MVNMRPVKPLLPVSPKFRAAAAAVLMGSAFAALAIIAFQEYCQFALTASVQNKSTLAGSPSGRHSESQNEPIPPMSPSPTCRPLVETVFWVLAGDPFHVLSQPFVAPTPSCCTQPQGNHPSGKWRVQKQGSRCISSQQVGTKLKLRTSSIQASLPADLVNFDCDAYDRYMDSCSGPGPWTFPKSSKTVSPHVELKH